MTEERTRTVLALLMVAGFFAVMLVVLLGFVDVREPTIAKLVGALLGYLTAVLNPVIFRYFGGGQKENPP